MTIEIAPPAFANQDPTTPEGLHTVMTGAVDGAIMFYEGSPTTPHTRPGIGHANDYQDGTRLEVRKRPNKDVETKLLVPGSLVNESLPGKVILMTTASAAQGGAKTYEARFLTPQGSRSPDRKYRWAQGQPVVGVGGSITRETFRELEPGSPEFEEVSGLSTLLAGFVEKKREAAAATPRTPRADVPRAAGGGLLRIFGFGR